MITRDVYSTHPICDTNILINLQLGNVFNDYLSFHGNINIADKVNDEMENKYANSKNYSFLLNVTSLEQIIIIYESIFTPKEINWMNTVLRSNNIYHAFGQKAYEKNAGELISALYAVILKIKTLYTDDKNFIAEYSDNVIFNNLNMLNLNETLKEFLPDKKRIACIRLIEARNPAMVRKLGTEQKLSKSNLLNRLKKFIN